MTATGFTVRPATVADIPAMHDVRLAVRENALRDPTRVQPADYAALLAGAGRGVVAEAGGRLVGFGIADGASRNLWALFVAPGFEGRGIGRALHDELLDWLFAQGDGPAWLTTGAGTRAERFYREAGWQPAGQAPGGDLRFEFFAFEDEA